MPLLAMPTAPGVFFPGAAFLLPARVLLKACAALTSRSSAATGALLATGSAVTGSGAAATAASHSAQQHYRASAAATGGGRCSAVLKGQTQALRLRCGDLCFTSFQLWAFCRQGLHLTCSNNSSSSRSSVQGCSGCLRDAGSDRLRHAWLS